MQKQLECKIKGRVQMVMFRDFVQRKATRLGLSGTVQNMSDRTVQVVAEGEEDKLQELLSLLHKGSIFSRVDKVEEKLRQPKGEFSGFRIVY